MAENKHKIGFVGLGYAGFPMACLFAAKYPVVGFDLSKRRIAELNSGVDHCGDVTREEIQCMLVNGAILTNNISDLQDCNIFIVAVPTPVDHKNRPDLSYISAASKEVGSILKKGDIVIYESTVYPGATEEICVPVLEEVSGLKYNEDFFVGYSPERINPGDKVNTPKNVVKVTSGSTPETAKTVNELYSNVLGKNLTFPASSIKVAEACKVVENAQRDINVAFMNEVAKLLNKMDIDTNEVVDAMNTKWNALNFRPGFVGGHCIGVDPYYLIELAKINGIDTRLMNTARKINNSMADYVVEKTVAKLHEKLGEDISQAKILILGFSFKENCPDIRNTKIYDVYRLLKHYTKHVSIYDPIVDSELVRNLYHVSISTNPRQISRYKYDAILLCVPHNAFKNLNIKQLCSDKGFIYDFKGFFPIDKCESLNIERI
ncbi:MAG: nucleotide sugar dehydrogenase [Muribaculaceae bacterium]|nr:nucleotide sugar dehydrogenase [Muribaculaceae bacterium]